MSALNIPNDGQETAEEAKPGIASTSLEPDQDQAREKSPLQLTPRDTRDPSYSHLKLPYRVICRQRLLQQAKAMREQFFREIRHDELFQNRALDGVRVHREFCRVAKTKQRLGMDKWRRADFIRLERLLDDRF